MDISQSLILLKPKDRGPRGNPKKQSEIDAYNQRKLINDVAKVYITGYKKQNIRVRYYTCEYPEKSNLLIGVLELNGNHGPYEVKKEIPHLDHRGKTIGQDIKPGQSWIRDGEDKRELLANEVIMLRDDANIKRREERKISKSKLGYQHSLETRKKMRESHKNISLETRKILT